MRVRAILRRSRLVRRLIGLRYSVPYRLASLVTRVRRNRILFLSDSHVGYTGNFGFLRDELLRQRPDAEIIGVFKPGLRARRPLRDTLRLPWLMATSGTIVLDDFYPLIYPLRIRAQTRLVQVWHAVGAYKQVGHSRAGLPGGPTPGSRIHRNYTDATVSSEAIRGDYAEAYGIDVTRVRALGVPRTDVFFDTERVARTRADVRERWGVSDDETLVLFAPTFRGNGQLSAATDESADWGAVTRDLGPGYRVAVRRHPFTVANGPALPDEVIDGADGEMNDILMAADVLVTDYSSSIFEFALLRRPIVMFVPDLDDYTGSRSFYRPFDHYVTGPVARSADELVEAIRGAEVDPVRMDAMVTEFCGALDGHSSQRIVRELFLTPPDEDPTRADVGASAPGGPAPAPTRAVGAIGLRVAVAAVTRFALRVLYAPLRLLPRRRKVVMISREHPTVPEDFRAVAEGLRRTDPTIEVVTMVRMVPPGLIGKLGYAAHMLHQLFHVATARVLVIDTYTIVASVLRHGPELTVIQMWHALGALKKFGLSILDQAEGRDARLAHAMRMHEGYDLVLASAEAARAPFAEALGTPVADVAVAPLPRVDRLRDPAWQQQRRAEILAVHPHLAERPVALFAPTFRLDGGVLIDAAALGTALEALGFQTVVKLHPLMAGHFGPAVDTADGFSTQDLMLVADVFLTDYSSALFEAAVVGVPGVFVAPDLDEYLTSRDFYLDYRTDLPGPVTRDIASAAAAVADIASDRAEAVARTEAFARRWVEVPESESATPCTDRIVALIVEAVDASR